MLPCHYFISAKQMPGAFIIPHHFLKRPNVSTWHRRQADKMNQPWNEFYEMHLSEFKKLLCSQKMQKYFHSLKMHIWKITIFLPVLHCNLWHKGKNSFSFIRALLQLESVLQKFRLLKQLLNSLSIKKVKQNFKKIKNINKVQQYIKKISKHN